MHPKQHRRGGQSNADGQIAAWRKGPVERSARIVEMPPVIGQPFGGWPRFLLGFGPLEKISVKFGVATRDRVQLAISGKLFERVGAGRFEEPIARQTPTDIRHAHSSPASAHHRPRVPR